MNFSFFRLIMVTLSSFFIYTAMPACSPPTELTKEKSNGQETPLTNKEIPAEKQTKEKNAFKDAGNFEQPTEKHQSEPKTEKIEEIPEVTNKERKAEPQVPEVEPEPTPEPIPKEKKFDPKGGDVEACIALRFGPYKSLKIVTDPSKAPELYQDHFGYQVKLQKGGVTFFKFNAFTKKDHFFFLSQDTKFTAQDKSGKVLATKLVEKQVNNCKQIKAKHTINLPQVAYYYFKIGPVAQDVTISMSVYDGHAH